MVLPDECLYKACAKEHDARGRHILTPPEQDASPEPAAPASLNLDDLQRNQDKLWLIERCIEDQAPLGTDLANFRRRLLLLVRA